MSDKTELTVWVKPNGNELKLNSHPATVAHARQMGWKTREDLEVEDAARAEAEEKAKQEAEAKARKEAEGKAAAEKAKQDGKAKQGGK